MVKVHRVAAVAIAALIFSLTAAAASAETFCFDEAGAKYSINPQILRAIAKVESNYDHGAINKNTNGTYDFGVMQINSIWAKVIGEEKWNNLGDPCSNIKTGAMILSGCMKKYGYTWQAIGCYNSQTPGKTERYARKVFEQLQRFQRNGEGPLPRGAEVEKAVVEKTAGTKVASLRNAAAGIAASSQAEPESSVPELDGSAVFDVDAAGLN